LVLENGYLSRNCCRTCFATHIVRAMERADILCAFFRLGEWQLGIRLGHLRGPQQTNILIFMVFVSGDPVW
jgi:hypothetical protein